MKGRNTSCITIRLPDSVVQSLQEKAKEAGLSSAGEYIKAQIIKSHSVIAMKEPTQIPESDAPFYNPSIHKAGDKVRIWQNGKQIEVIVPSLS